MRGERIVQEALDRVSKNRTTITIAHRLSTIRKADKIIVLRTGAAIEEGSHEELLNKGGLYCKLVSNQQLAVEEDQKIYTFARDSIGSDHLALSKSVSKTGDDEADHVREVVCEKDYEHRSLVNSVGLFIWEQRTYWLLYATVLAAAAGCGGQSDEYYAVHMGMQLTFIHSYSGVFGPKLSICTARADFPVHGEQASREARFLVSDVFYPGARNRNFLYRPWLEFNIDSRC